MKVKNTGKALAFFGTDVQESLGRIIRGAYKQGYMLIALDSQAIAIADREQLPCTLIGDWVNAEAMLRAKQEGAEWEQRWFEDAREEFTVNGICWPEFDREAMYWFWQTVSLSIVFIEALRKNGIIELRYFQSDPLRPALYYYLTDVHTVFWQKTFGPGAEIYDPPSNREQQINRFLKKIKICCLSPVSRFFRSLLKEADGLLSRGKNGHSDNNRYLNGVLSLEADAEKIAGKIVIAINPGEIYRLTKHIREIVTRFQNNVVISILSGGQEQAAKVASEFSLPVLFCHEFMSRRHEVTDCFYKGFRELLQIDQNTPWYSVLQSMTFHFDYYFTKRWPDLQTFYECWQNILKSYRPSIVIVSSLEDSESQIPAAAANRLNIPTFSLSHGIGFTRKTLVKARYVLYNFETDREGYLRSGISPEHLIGCRELMTDNEYSVHSQYTLTKDPQQWHVLVLTAPTTRAGCLFPAINPGDQIVALQAIDCPPAPIASKLAIHIKVHPGHPDREIIARASPKLMDRVLPHDMELRTALEIADLVVALNYSGPAVIHTVRARKPLIHFWVDQCIGQADPYVYADIYLPSGLLVHNADDFWEAVRKFFTDDEFAEMLCQRSRTFLQEKLQDNHLPKLGDLLYEQLHSALVGY